MGLLRKMRILVGGLIHKPFMPRPQRVQLEASSSQAGETEKQADAGAEVSQEIEQERVADLIAVRRAGAGEGAGTTASSHGASEREPSS
jgi:hypothetical protein